MANKNIQIRVHNGSDFDYLFPKTKAGLVETAGGKTAEQALTDLANDLALKASKDVATTLADGLLSAADKAKLDGVEADANNYAHPANHPASIITQDTSNRFVTDAEKAEWSGKQDAIGFVPEDASKKGVANGYAPLDVNSKVPMANIPDLAKQATHVVLDSAARKGLTGLVAGERAFETSTGDSYIWDGSAWRTLAKAEWNNINLQWTNILDKPVSTTTAIDGAVAKAHEHTNKAVLDATTASFTAEEEAKLAGIAEGANNYVHPSNHAAAEITETSDKMFVSQAEKDKWNKSDSIVISALEPVGAAAGDFWYEEV